MSKILHGCKEPEVKRTSFLVLLLADAAHDNRIVCA